MLKKQPFVKKPLASHPALQFWRCRMSSRVCNVRLKNRSSDLVGDELLWTRFFLFFFSSSSLRRREICLCCFDLIFLFSLLQSKIRYGKFYSHGGASAGAARNGKISLS
jgi:hypothetical protein